MYDRIEVQGIKIKIVDSVNLERKDTDPEMLKGYSHSVSSAP